MAVAEKSFRDLTALSAQHREVRFVAVSHSSREVTERWVIQVGGQWEADVVVDEGREIYAAWGLGVSSIWHILNPVSIFSAIQLASSEGIWNRATESGTRWQTSGAFALDKGGIIRWLHVSRSADDMPNLEEALAAIRLTES